MIIAEARVKVPSKKYKICVQCTKTRRLTAMEWLVLTCISRFKDSETMSKKTMKNAFETVLELQDSNLLINPCINELKKIEVIDIAGDSFEYNRTRFSSLSLTPKGEKMLKDGLLPGASSTFIASVWYNPLTNQINSQEIRKAGANVRVFGEKELYDVEFPEALIKSVLQSGLISAGQFVASEYIIDAVDTTETMDAESIIALTASIDESNVLTINPPIVNSNMRNRVQELLLPTGMTENYLKTFVSKDSVEIDKVFGSGEHITKAIHDICRNSRFLFVESSFYEVYRSILPEYFAGKTIVVFNYSRFCTTIENASYILYVPFSFCVSGCMLINDKNESVSLCRAKSVYEGNQIVYPLAIKDKRISRKNGSIIKWFESELLKASKKDIGYIGAFSLPFMKGLISHTDTLKELWKNKNLDAILIDIKRINSISNGIALEKIDFEPLKPLLLSKIETNNDEQFISNSRKLASSEAFIKGLATHCEIVASAMSRLPNRPQKYSDLVKLQNAFGVNSLQIADSFEDIFDSFYDESIVFDVIKQILDGSFNSSRDLFRMDVLFNSYSGAINDINFLLAIDLFKRQDYKILRKTVINCPDIALLQTHLFELSDSSAFLVKRKINIYKAMLTIDQARGSVFYENLNLIEQFINEKIQGIVPSDVSEKKASEQNEKIDESVYVIDTCALINNSELLLYFKSSDYVRIPMQVIAELGRIKDGHSNYKDRETAKQIGRRLSKEIKFKYLKTCNKMNECLFMTDKAAIELLPPDLRPDVPDHIILSTMFKYKNWDATLITDDIQFTLLAEQFGFKVLSGKEFIDSHKSSYCPISYIDEKYMASNAPSASVLKWISEHTDKVVNVE